MTKALKTLRAMQWSMLASILICVLIGEVLRSRTHGRDTSYGYIFTTLGVALVGVIFVVRRTLVFRVAAALAQNPDDTLSLNQWKTGYIATYAMCGVMALFGLVQRFLGGTSRQSAPYYFCGFVLLLFFRSQRPQQVAETREV